MRKKIIYIFTALLIIPAFVLAKPKTSIEKRWNAHSKEWIVSEKSDYSYSTEHKDKKAEELRYAWNSYENKWSQMLKINYDYDKKGRLVTETTYNYYAPSSSWKALSKSEYEYKEDTIINLTYKYNNYADRTTDWINDKKTVTPISKKKKGAEVTYRWTKNNEWELREERSFNYNSSGLVESESATTTVNGQVYGSLNIGYKYDKKGNIIEKDVKESHGAGCNHDAKFTYEYQ